MSEISSEPIWIQFLPPFSLHSIIKWKFLLSERGKVNSLEKLNYILFCYLCLKRNSRWLWTHFHSSPKRQHISWYIISTWVRNQRLNFVISTCFGKFLSFNQVTASRKLWNMYRRCWWRMMEIDQRFVGNTTLWNVRTVLKCLGPIVGRGQTVYIRSFTFSQNAPSLQMGLLLIKTLTRGLQARMSLDKSTRIFFCTRWNWL